MKSALSAVFVAAILATGLALTAPATAQETEGEQVAIDWQAGPSTGRLGDLAEINVPEGFLFSGSEGARTFLELTENIPSGTELGVLIPVLEEGDDGSKMWFVIFEFSEVGYIKDDDRDELDPDGLLSTIREGTEQANEVRRENGWDTLNIVGWHTSPFYDVESNNLTWAIRAESGGAEVVNYSTRLLGRKGYMQADLVLSPQGLDTAVPQFQSILGEFDYVSGERYAEFRSGDKIAAYGLTALVAGGAGALAAKTGLFAKFWKLIVAVFIAIGAFIKKIFRAIFGKKEEQVQV